MRNQIFIIFLIIFCFGNIYGQTLEFELKSQHIDTVYVGKTYSIVFNFQNNCTQKCYVMDVISDCNFLSFQYPDGFVNPLMKSSISCMLYSNNFTEKYFDKNLKVIVKSDENQLDTITLNVTANIIKSIPELSIEKIDTSVCSFQYVKNNIVDTLIFDFGEIESGKLKHAVFKIKSTNGQPIPKIPNSEEFLNFDYNAILGFFPSMTNPLIEGSQEKLPYKFYRKKYDEYLSTKTSKPVEWVDSAYINIFVYNFRGTDYNSDSVYSIMTDGFGSTPTLLIFKVKFIYGNEDDIIWVHNGEFKANFYLTDFMSLNAGLPPNVHIKDFNNDKVLDTIKVFYSINYYPKKYKTGAAFIDGATNKTYHFSYPYSTERDGFFINFNAFDEELLTSQNRPIISMMEDTLFGKHPEKIGPSLEWLLKYYESDWKEVDSPFSFKMQINPVWYPWPAAFPTSYIAWYKFDSTMDRYYTEPGEGWLYYIGGYHTITNWGNHYKREKWFHLVTQNETYKIYKTAHGVIAQKGAQYCWIFHSDGGAKLRWPEIGDAWLFGKYVIVERDYPLDFGSGYIMINIETGQMKTLAFHKIYGDLDCDCWFHIEIKNGSLILKKYSYDQDEKFPKEYVKLYKLVREFDKE